MGNKYPLSIEPYKSLEPIEPERLPSTPSDLKKAAPQDRTPSHIVSFLQAKMIAQNGKRKDSRVASVSGSLD